MIKRIKELKNGMKLLGSVIVLLTVFLLSGNTSSAQQPLPLEISENGRYFQTTDGEPFFWLGDTGWLLFTKCNREEVITYLDTRQNQGFNVIQIMVLHTLGAKNAYGQKALIEENVANPYLIDKNKDDEGYDYWDHMDFVIEEAARRGMYAGLVPVWGSAVKASDMTAEQAAVYAAFLAERYRDRTNVIWLNGGDVYGSQRKDIWLAIGETLKEKNPDQLVTYHPRGRYSSTDWFHHEEWLDFNMFQSGHRTYAQDTSATEKHNYGEDNWRYAAHDWNMKPIKPVLDGEPSYENIPKGLHDPEAPRWNDADVRRYAYWSVFAGAAGFTYGENSIMQFHRNGDAGANFGVGADWDETIYAPGATQLQFLKKLMLRKDYFSRRPAQEIIVDNDHGRYRYVLATMGDGYAMAYTFTGEAFEVDMSLLDFQPERMRWYNPSNGEFTNDIIPEEKGVAIFNPPGKHASGTDWVLVLEK